MSARNCVGRGLGHGGVKHPLGATSLVSEWFHSGLFWFGLAPSRGGLVSEWVVFCVHIFLVFQPKDLSCNHDKHARRDRKNTSMRHSRAPVQVYGAELDSLDGKFELKLALFV